MSRRALCALVCVAVTPAGPVLADDAAVNWVPGPAVVALGEVAQVDLKPGYVFADASGTQKLMEMMGNRVSGNEVGLVSPQAEGQDWILVFDYHAVGYVKDDEKDKIDENALFRSIQEGTEQANEYRKQKGMPGLHVVRWFEEPHYDSKSHNLVWALLAREDGGGEVVNYNMRVLGREGYMSVTLVDEPRKLAASKPLVQNVLHGFSYKSGKTYAEFRPGDKIAEYGLMALVAGGAGAAALKLGLFAALWKAIAKGGKALVLVVVAALAGLKKLFSSISGRRNE